MTDHVRGIVDSIRWLVKVRTENNEPLENHVLITTQSLIDLVDEFEQLEKSLEESQISYDMMCDVSSDYYHEIRELEAAAPKWISVEERLPEDLERVLTVDVDGYMMTGYILCDTGVRGMPCYCENGYDSLDNVTHWMPLPEPPKEVE